MQIAVGSAVGVSYSEHVNPQWVRLLDLLDMNVRYERCLGSELFTADGRKILDFLSGYCVHNVGHNHPAVIYPETALTFQITAPATVVTANAPQAFRFAGQQDYAPQPGMVRGAPVPSTA